MIVEFVTRKPYFTVLSSEESKIDDPGSFSTHCRLFRGCPARSVPHLLTLGASLREHSIDLEVLEQSVDTSAAKGRAMFGMLSVLAELQGQLIVTNTRGSLAAARPHGRTGGRRPRLTPRKPAIPKSSTTQAITPSNRSPTCSGFPAPRSTGTSTKNPSASVRPPPRRPPPDDGSRTAARSPPVGPVRFWAHPWPALGLPTLHTRARRLCNKATGGFSPAMGVPDRLADPGRGPQPETESLEAMATARTSGRESDRRVSSKSISTILLLCTPAPSCLSANSVTSGM